MKILLIALLWVIQAVAVDTNSTNTEESRLVNGTSVGHYLKPGLAVEIVYSSQHVAVGEKSDLNITLSTLAIESGTLKVTMKSDKGLTGLNDSNKEFEITEEEKTFSINLALTAGSNGIYYVNLFAEVEGRGMRAFAVPVYVGDTKNTLFKKTLNKTDKGDNISVSSASEEIISE